MLSSAVGGMQFQSLYSGCTAIAGIKPSSSIRKTWAAFETASRAASSSWCPRIGGRRFPRVPGLSGAGLSRKRRDDSEFADSIRGDAYMPFLRMLTRSAVEVKKEYRASHAVAMGYSMGGFGVLQLVATAPRGQVPLLAQARYQVTPFPFWLTALGAGSRCGPASW